MILVVGGTGVVGGNVVEELHQRGLPVRCLVREGSDISKLQKDGIELIYGDVRDPKTIKEAVSGADTVISSFATRILQDRGVAALWQADYEGNLSLIRAAQDVGVKKFIFVSYWGLAKFGNFEHGKIKKLVEDLLSVSGIDYTVFRVTTLATDMSLLLGSTLKKKGWAPMLMKKTECVRPILPEDLAWCMVDAIENTKASCKTIEVAGEEEYTFVELENLFKRCIDRKARFIFIPPVIGLCIAGLVDLFKNDKYNAKGLVSAFTGGSTCNIDMMKEIFGIKQGSFKKHIEDYLKKGELVLQKPIQE